MNRVQIEESIRIRIEKTEKKLKPYKEKETLVKNLSAHLNSGLVFAMVRTMSTNTIKIVKSLESILESDKLLLEEISENKTDENSLREIIKKSKKNNTELVKAINMSQLNDKNVVSKLQGILK